MFDAHRARKALDGQLRDGDSLRHTAVDDVTGDFWLLTSRELVIARNGRIAARFDLEALRGEVITTGNGVEVRVRDAARPELSFASFRRANKVTDELSTLLSR